MGPCPSRGRPLEPPRAAPAAAEPQAGAVAEVEPEPETHAAAEGGLADVAVRPPRTTGAAASARLAVTEERLARARAAGEGARRKVAGSAARVPKTPRRQFPQAAEGSQYYVIVRGKREHSDVKGFGRTWQAVAPLVARGRGVPANEAVFHRWESLEEALEYWRAATGEPWPLAALH